MTDTTDQARPDHARIDDSLAARREMTWAQSVTRTQPFWVLIAILVIGLVMMQVSDVFMTERNMFNVARNFAFFGIMAQVPTGCQMLAMLVLAYSIQSSSLAPLATTSRLGSYSAVHA